jgi:hypothetical protein
MSSDIRVRVHRVNDLHIIALCNPADGRADTFERLTEAFATMSGHNDQAFCGVKYPPF